MASFALQPWQLLVASFVEHPCEREIECLARESQLLKAELEILNGGKSIELSKEDRSSLRKASEGIDPEVLKRGCVIDLDETSRGDSQRSSS